MMKFTSFEVYDLAKLAAAAAERPAPHNQFAQLVNADIAALVGHTDLVVEQYSTILFGNIITDEGLDLSDAETLSFNDDHDQADDLAYFHSRAKELGAAFGTFCWFENEILSVFHFIAE